MPDITLVPTFNAAAADISSISLFLAIGFVVFTVGFMGFVLFHGILKGWIKYPYFLAVLVVSVMATIKMADRFSINADPEMAYSIPVDMPSTRSVVALYHDQETPNDISTCRLIPGDRFHIIKGSTVLNLPHAFITLSAGASSTCPHWIPLRVDVNDLIAFVNPGDISGVPANIDDDRPTFNEFSDLLPIIAEIRTTTGQN